MPTEQLRTPHSRQHMALVQQQDGRHLLVLRRQKHIQRPAPLPPSEGVEQSLPCGTRQVSLCRNALVLTDPPWICTHAPGSVSTVPSRPHPVSAMIGPQRLSLLDGEVLRRQYSARATLDQFLDKLVDAFDFQIETRETRVRRLSTEKPPILKSIGEAYTSLKEKASESSAWKPKKSWSFPALKKQSMAALINEALCAWILNASPDGEKTNPLELGWSTRKNELEADDNLVFHCDDKEELPLVCGYTCMTC